MRKVRIEDQELKDAIVGEVGGVDLTVGFEGGAGPQQPDPFQIFESVVGFLRRLEAVVVVDLKQPRGRRSAFDIAPNLDELPALAMAQGSICHSLEQMNAIDDRGQELGETKLGAVG